MISLTKKLVYGVAITGSIALAVPALLDARKPELERKTVERPADGSTNSIGLAQTGAEGEMSAPFESDALPEATIEANAATPSSETTPVDANATLDALARLERSLAKLDSFGGRSGFDRRRRALARDELGDSTSVAPEETPTSPRFIADRRDSETMALEQRAALEALQTFVAEMPMRGLLRGENDAVVMFGGRAVRVGDELIPDGAVLTAIDARGVLVDVLGKEVRLDIPPVITRPRVRDDTQTAGDGEAEQGPTGAAGAAAPKAEPATAQTAGKEAAQP